MSSIPLAALAVQPQQPVDPLSQYAKVLQIKSLLGQQALQPGQLQQQQANLQATQQENQMRSLQIKSQQGISQALIDAKGDRNAFLGDPSNPNKPGLISDPKYGITPQDQLSVQQKYLEMSDAAQKMNKDSLEAAQQAHTQITQHLNNVINAPPEDQPAQYQLEYNAIKRDQTLSQYMQQIPPQFPGADELTKIDNGMKLTSQLLAEAKDKREAPGQVATSTKAVQEASMTPAQRAAISSPELQAQQASGMNPFQYQTYMKKLVPEFNFNLQNAGVGGAPGKPSAIAQGLADGSIKWQDVVANRTPMNVKQQLLAEVKQINPNFNSGDFSIEQSVKKEFTSGTAATNLTAFNTAIDHAKQLSKAADALNNGDVRGLNAIGNQLGYQFGSDKTTNFNVIKNALSGEISKVFKGGQATDAEIQQVKGPFDSANSPQQLKGAINNAITLMNSKRDNLQKQYEAGVKAQPNFGENQQQAAPQHTPGGKAQGLTEGATGTGSDGKKYVVKGGVWVQQ